MEKSMIIILNGPSSSGKTTLAKSIQENSEKIFHIMSLDMFVNMLPERKSNHSDVKSMTFINLGDEKILIDIHMGEVMQRTVRGMRHAIAAMAQQCNNIIVDDVILCLSDVQHYADLLRDHEMRLVGLFAPIEVLELRERLRGDREIGLTRWHCARVHNDVAYDLELDTATLTPLEAAGRICAAFKI